MGPREDIGSKDQEVDGCHDDQEIRMGVVDGRCWLWACESAGEKVSYRRAQK